MLSISVIAILLGFGCTIGGGVLFFKRFPNTLVRYLGLFTFSAGLWSLSNGFADGATSVFSVTVWSGLALISFNFFASFFLCFVISFAFEERFAWLRVIAWVPSILMAPWAFSSYSVASVVLISSAPAQIIPGGLYIIGPVFLYSAFGASYILLTRYFRKFSLRERVQAVYILIGSVPTLLGFTIFDILLPLHGELRFFTVGPLFSIALIAAASYAILRHEIEKKVVQRTETIAKLQENQTQTFVELSHALQTPLTVIRGEIEVLHDRAPSNTHIRAFQRSIEDLSQFTYDLLSIARLESNVGLEHEMVFNFSNLADEIAEYFMTLAEAEGVLVEVTIERDILMYGDARHMNELLRNLLGNALKYMRDASEKRLVLELRDTRGEIQLRVSDTGCGIPAADLPYVFDKFYRSAQGSDQIRGTGIGLAVCKAIAEAHDGTIRAESEIGKGSTFIVSFSKKQASPPKRSPGTAS
jgi:signal transduction histidine kinase